MVTRYDDIKAIFADHQTFSSENTAAPVRAYGPPTKQIMADGGFSVYSGLSSRQAPEHTRIRSVVIKGFTPRRLRQLEPAIRERVTELLDAMLSAPDAQGEIVRDIAYDLPTETILKLIGVNPDMVPTFKRWSDSRAAMTWGDLDDEQQIPHAHNLVEYWQECQNVVAQYKENLGENFTSDLLRAQAEGDPITDHEIASVLYSLLFAGHETTTTLLANSLRVLLPARAQWESLVADPTGIPAAVEEVLRFSGSIVAWRRRATRDAEIAGVSIPKGANILVVMGSANRDPSRFEHPDDFDVARPNVREHLSFGFGIHTCIGAPLARMQMKIVLEELIRRVPQLRAVDPEAIEFRENLSFRVPTAVPVAWNEV
ncbi:cytochrome P450 [Microbacterium sp. CH12i]|uniref:cytochrome P450 n=1 Tax=Microbacterium sp. CH12i TaxID=1479651 RepID=UPI001F203999|nr:cytochrome P450 [Microbacterium sp. CH12i]